MQTSKLNVFIRFHEKEDLVGQLVLNKREILFKYCDSYLEMGQNISPLKLLFTRDIQTGPVVPFNGLFGVFADSLPDAWGELLLKKHLSRKGVPLETINVLDRLTFVGNNGLGALVYRPSNCDKEIEIQDVDLDFFGDNVHCVLKGESSEIIDLLFEKGGSPGGARPKICVSYNPVSDSLVYGSSKPEQGFEHWIIKYAAGIDTNDIANIEMAYHYMAFDAGIEMSECRLFTGQSGKKYFGTKRFDRIGNHRLQMISSAGLLHDDYEHSQLDYGILMQEGGKLINSAKAYKQLLLLAAFNIFAHNRDDHSKNFAFLMEEGDQWKIAPAYDLTFSSSSHGQHSTTCAFNGINPGVKELLELVGHFSIKHGKEVVEKVKYTVSNWNEYAEKAEVSKISRSMIDRVLCKINVKN